jgi:predicted SprT family Zn-dependent metalloprotease
MIDHWKLLARKACLANGMSDEQTTQFTNSIIWETSRRMASTIAQAHVYHRTGKKKIRVNAIAFENDPKTGKPLHTNPDKTIVHEVCHLIAYSTYGPRIQPHGRQWRHCMRNCGYSPDRTTETTAAYKEAVKHNRKTQRRWNAQCGCMVHQISTRKRNLILFEGRRWICRRCKEALTL